jgi:hypothetical protein
MYYLRRSGKDIAVLQILDFSFSLSIQNPMIAPVMNIKAKIGA